jgi:hypothetical protein
MNPLPPGGAGTQIQGDEPADDDEVHGSAGFDDELHEQTGASRAPGPEESRYSYSISGAGQTTTNTRPDEDAPHAEEEEDPAMGGY